MKERGTIRPKEEGVLRQEQGLGWLLLVGVSWWGRAQLTIETATCVVERARI